MKTTWVLLLTAVSMTSLAQVQVQKGDKKVDVGPDGAVRVQKGSKTVNVGPDGAVQVQKGDTTVQVDPSGVTTTTSDDATVTTGARAATATSQDGVWEVAGQGRADTHACAANEDVKVSGQGHDITLSGPCRRVAVSGQGNTVTADEVASIAISGVSNTVHWKTAPKGKKKPAIKLSGLKNSAPQLK